MTPENYRLNHGILASLKDCLDCLGYQFNVEKTVTVTGEYITGLFKNSYNLHEDAAYFRDLMPRSIKIVEQPNSDRLYLTIDVFRQWQIQHYKKRLEDAASNESRSFLRTTLHGLKK